MTVLAARRVLPVSAAVGAGATLTYVLRAAPTTYLLDSSELVATTSSLAVSHPPGHPAFHLLAAIGTWLPLGTHAFRLHVFDAAVVALLVACIPLIAWRLGWLTRGPHLLVAGIVAVGAAFTNALLFQAVRAEVYGLHTLLVGAALLAVARRPETSLDPRLTALAALLLGVGLANHHYLILFTFPAFAWAVVSATPPGKRLRALGIGCLFGVIPLLSYAYLPLRAAARPPIGWGWPSSMDEMVWLVTAQAFQKTAANAVDLDIGAGLTNVLGVLADQFTIFGVFGAVAGFVLLALRERRIALTLGLLAGFNLLTQTLFAFDPMNPDVLGYFGITSVVVALLLTYGAIAVGEGLRLRAARVGDAVTVVAALGLALGMTWSSRHGERTSTLARTWDADALRDAVWLGLAPDALVVTGYFETQFNAWYGIGVEDRRPDIIHVHRGFRTYPFYDAMLLAQHPDAAPLLTPPPGTGLLDVSGLREHAAQRGPVWLEPELLFEPALVDHVIPHGLGLRVVAPTLPEGRLPVAMRSEHLDALARLQLRLGEPVELQTRRNLLWSTYQLASKLCDAGRSSHCRTLAGAALDISPGDPDVQALVERAEAMR